MMNRNKRADTDDEDAACTRDGCDGTFVDMDHEHVCNRCGYVRGTGGQEERSYRERHLPDEWVSFEKERSQYNGFYGPDRIKFVGGFARPYDF